MRSLTRKRAAPSARGIISLIAGLTLVILDQGCSPSPGYLRSEQENGEELRSLLGGSFETCWNRNTILLRSQSSGGAGATFLSGGGPDWVSFPLNVRATIMDSLLVEAGIQEFGRLACMDTNGLEMYRKSYRARYRLDENIFVYVEMQTFLAEDYLRVARWIFFVEDEKGNQVEPERVVEHPVQRQGPRSVPSSGLGGPEVFGAEKRIIEFYFPLDRFPEGVRALRKSGLKLVLLDAGNPLVRAEGTWNLATPR